MATPRATAPARGARAVGVASIRFTVEVLGRSLGAFGTARGLEAHVDVLEYREGGMNDVVHRLPGQIRYPNLVLGQGSTGTALEEWFALTRLGAARHEMTLTMHAPGDGGVRAWTFADAFPVRWTGPTLAAGMSATAAEELEIAHAGFRGKR
jgi:phage tail-like protein